MLKIVKDVELLEEPLQSTQPPADVIAFNELRSCADLFRLYESKALDIQPPYQREVVWKPIEQSLFIDSLIKQLPIPSMCFSLDYKSQKWQVVDGLQRMTAIVSFLNPKKSWKISDNEEIDPLIRGVTNLELANGNEQQNILFSKVQNISLPITVIRCDPNRADHSEYLFTIFHRLNSGGKQLNHQEIRNCIFSGPYNDQLRLLDLTADWKKIKKSLPSRGARFRSIELILRFFALHEAADSYSGNLPNFLNSYMRGKRFSENTLLTNQEQLFDDVSMHVSRALASLGSFPLSYTLLEAIMLGVAANLNRVAQTNDVALGLKIVGLADEHEFASDEAKVGTTKATSVRARVNKARKFFAS